MNMQSLELRQGQSLVMTQQLRQSIELLQLSSNELQEMVAVELEKNPLLTSNEETSDAAEKAETKLDKLDMSEATLWGVGGEDAATLRFEGAYDGAYHQAGSGGDYADFMAERMVAHKTLHQELMSQLQNKPLDALQLKMAEAVIDMIDSSGYLPLDYVQRAQVMGIKVAQLEHIMRTIHECEPTGVGARNLQECLHLQLQERGLLDAVMLIVIGNLPLIAEGNAKKLCRLCGGVSERELQQYIAKIRQCNPKPASDYEIIAPQTLIPDVMVRRGANAEGETIWELELNSDILPKIAIDVRYSKQFVAGLRDKDDGKVINEHLSNANWLLKSLQQRNNTLLNVATAIVLKQKDFFDFGIAYLHPMTLRDVAVAANCHESTVSRITTQKYMATERGIFELKYFFTSNLVNSNGGGNYSSRSVMYLIEQIIKREELGQAFSDEAITTELHALGIEVARRTVVKYRQQLGIAPSNERKKQRK